MKIPARIAVAVSLLFMLNPAMILYESVYAYTILTVFLLTSSIYTLVVFLVSRKQFHWIMFCFTLAGLVLTRSSFHLLWMVLIISLLIVLSRRTLPIPSMRSMILGATLPLLLIIAWYGKNAMIFGSFGASSWLGMNLSRMVQPETPLGNAGPFRPLEDYSGMYVPDTSVVKAAVLLQERKQKTRYINFYHRDYITISKQLLAESIEHIKVDPGTYFRSVAQSFTVFFSPATHAPFIDRNQQKIRIYVRIMTPDFSSFDRYRSVSSTGLKDKATARLEFMKVNHLTVSNALPAALIFLVTIGSVVAALRKQLMTPVDKGVALFLVVTFAYGMLVGTLLEFGENNRFRFEISLPIYILLTLSMVRLYQFFKTSRVLSKD